MVGMGDCWSAIRSHARVAADGEVAAGQGRRGYGEIERERKKREEKK